MKLDYNARVAHTNLHRSLLLLLCGLFIYLCCYCFTAVAAIVVVVYVVVGAAAGTSHCFSLFSFSSRLVSHFLTTSTVRCVCGFNDLIFVLI